MSRRAVLAAGLGASLPVRAGEPWKVKSLSEWTDADLVRMLNDSPWARPVEVVMGSPELSIIGGGPGGFIDRGPKRPHIPFVVRWVSALPYKEAYARARYGEGEGALKLTKEYLA